VYLVKLKNAEGILEGCISNFIESAINWLFVWVRPVPGELAEDAFHIENVGGCNNMGYFVQEYACRSWSFKGLFLVDRGRKGFFWGRGP